MKKTLLLAASAMLAIGTSAQTLTEPLKNDITGGIYYALSPNGRFAVGDNLFLDAVEVLDLEEGDVALYADEEEMDVYSVGRGVNAVSNSGIVMLSTSYSNTAAYVEDGELHFLPLPEGCTSALCNAITPDGSRIAGTVGIGMTVDDETMQAPVVWNRQADGTYSMPVALPYPKADLTGRLPQYVMVDGITADGKTIACQLKDYFGSIDAPFIIKEKADGTWAYAAIGEELLNPAAVEFPEDPGNEPSPVDFMSEESKAAYEAAVAYAETLEQPSPIDFMTEEEYAAYREALSTGWANPTDFMTEEEAAAYSEAADSYWDNKYPSAANYLTEEEAEAYHAACEAWEEAFYVFQDAYVELLMTATIFGMNEFAISPDGKYYAVSASTDMAEKMMMDENPTYQAYTFNLESGNYKVKGIEGETVVPTGITNDGGIVAGNMNFDGYIASSYDAPLIPLQDYIREADPELYEFMEENMYVEVAEWDEEEEEEVTYNRWMTGIPFCTPDLTTIGTYVIDFTAEMPIYSYFMPVTHTTGIQNTMASDDSALKVRMNANGDIELNGQASDVTVYDMSGRVVYNAQNPASSVKTGLGRGQYIVKANGQKNVSTGKFLR